MQNKFSCINRVRRYVDATNNVLRFDMLRVANRRRKEKGKYLVEVFWNTDLVFPNLINCMCSHTCTRLYGITYKDKKICILLADGKNDCDI